MRRTRRKRYIGEGQRNIVKRGTTTHPFPCLFIPSNLHPPLISFMKTHRFYYKSLSLFMSLSHPYHSRHPYLFQYEPSSLQSLFHPVLDLYRLCFIFPPFSITYTSCTLVKSLILTFSPFLIYVFAGLHQLSPSCPSILKRSLAYVPGYLFIVFFFFFS